MRCGSPSCVSCDKRKIDVLRLFEPTLQGSAGRLNISYERLPSMQELLELWLVAPTDETIAVATCDSVCMDFRWWQPGPFGSLAFTFLTTEVEEFIFHRILLVVAMPRHFPLRAGGFTKKSRDLPQALPSLRTEQAWSG